MPRKIAPRKCSECGRKFKPHHLTSKFCSKSCAWAGTKGPDYNRNLARETAERRGDTQRHRGQGKSYRKLNGRHEHRVRAEEMLGRPLRKGEVVHHKDGDHLNNDPSNLEVMSQAEHMREHGLGIPGVAPKHLQKARA